MLQVPAQVLLLALLSTTDPGAARGDEEGPSAELAYAAAKALDVLLPTEPWRPVGPALVLAGRTFTVERPSDGKLLIDVDGDGQTDERVTGATSFVQLRVRAEADGREPFRYALHLRRAHADWEWAPACWMAGRLGTTSVRLIDLSGDGTYDDFGVDALVTGRGDVAALLSRVVALDGALFQLAVDADGARLTTRPYEGPVGRLDVTSGFVSEGELVAAVFASGEFSFDLAGAPRGGALVPAGEYRFVSGLARRGAETAHIDAGDLAPVHVGEGADATLSWGGPLRADFRYAVVGSQLTVYPDVRFFGSAGECYRDFAPIAQPPKIVVKDAATGRVVQYGRLGGCCGGGFSSYMASVPPDTRFEITLLHKRGLFGQIVGRPRHTGPETPGRGR